jgi:hypothetical protein
LWQITEEKNPPVDKRIPEVILKPKWILQSEDKNVLKDENGIKWHYGLNCEHVFQVQVEVTDIMWHGTISVSQQIDCLM